MHKNKPQRKETSWKAKALSIFKKIHNVTISMQQEKEAEEELHEINDYGDFWNLKNMYKVEDKVKKIF